MTTVAAIRAALGSTAVPASLVLLSEIAREVAPGAPCTPRTTLPRHPGGRRRAVLVAGLGSSAGAAAVHDVDTAALGYAPADVTRFSYRGGDVATTPYGAVDTFDGVEGPARALRALVERLVRAEPAVPVDLLAHSMGGLVVRTALVGPRLAGVSVVATLGTPHRGAPLAGAAQVLLAEPAGRTVAEVVARSGVDLDPASRSVRQLAPGSTLLRRLAAAGPPAVDGPVLALGARTDLVVPVLRARWPGQRSVTVDVAGPAPAAHAALPGSPSATRELALLLGGAPPTCRSRHERVLDAVVGLGVEAVTVQAGFVLAAAPG